VAHIKLRLAEVYLAILRRGPDKPAALKALGKKARALADGVDVPSPGRQHAQGLEGQ